MRISGASIRLAGSATFSGYVAPTIFGAISANTMIRNATMPVAIDSTRLLWPNVRSAIDVVSTGMIVLIRLLPIRMTLSNWSVLASRPCVVRARSDALVGEVFQTMAIERHHRCFGNREEAGAGREAERWRKFAPIREGCPRDR